MTPGRSRAGRERSVPGMTGRNVILNIIPDLIVIPDLIGDPNRF